MTNEAVLVYETHVPISMTCADNAGIEKGAVLALTDPMTVATSSADNDVFGGIAAEEKIINDGKTKIAVYRQGVFKMTVGGGGSATTVGFDVVLMGINLITNRTTLDDEIGLKVGKALETAAAGETCMVEVSP